MENIEKCLGKITGGAIWKPTCPVCNKEMLGGKGVKRVDGTRYKHPYFCEDCVLKLDKSDFVNNNS